MTGKQSPALDATSPTTTEAGSDTAPPTTTEAGSDTASPTTTEAGSDATSQTTTEADLLLSVDEMVAGYLPGINILNGCSLELRRGEIIGVIGPNGAGKSTLLKAIFGLVDVREGTVSLEGEDITGLNPHKLVARGIGFVPQSHNVFPRLSIRENLEMGVFQTPKQFNDRLKMVTELFPMLAERSDQRGRRAVGRGAPDGGHRPSFDDGPHGRAAG